MDVLERVQALYPHPYAMAELIEFTNELGAILKTNYCEEYKTITVKQGELLPDEINREDIIRVICDGRVLSRDDFLESAVLVFPGSERMYIEIGGKPVDAEIICRVKYSPVRYVKFCDEVTLIDGGFSLPNEYDIRSGDILISENERFTVDRVEVTDEGFKVFGSGNFTEGTKNIERMIDDLTVCDAPYDRIYTEFLLSKVARFQKDYETENRALANYNALLEDYEKFLVRNGKKKRTSKFYNFW